MDDSAAAFDEDVPGFPGCKHCRYRQTGPIDQCVTCAHQETPRAIVVTGQRSQSAGGTLADKQAAAEELSKFLLVPDPARVEGRRVVVYDDVMTTGETLNVIARALRDAGALEVSGIVLARQPW